MSVDTELVARPLGPDSFTWRISGDRRMVLAGGAALILQVSHPAVGAGVKQHSDFRADPWGRLDDTLQAAFRYIFGGDKALAEGKRLREMHTRIKGIDHHGNRYHALQPETYHWVHATLYYALVRYTDVFVRRLTDDERHRLYAEWRQVGGVLGIPERVMPSDLAAFQRYFDDMIANQLEDNETVRDVLDALTLKGIAAPPLWYVPNMLWPPARPVGRAVLRLSTIGLMPPALRDRLALDWTDKDEKRLRRMAAQLRTVAPLVPPRLRYYRIAIDAKRAAGLPLAS